MPRLFRQMQLNVALFRQISYNLAAYYFAEYQTT
jgi:hypothetical protein